MRLQENAEKKRIRGEALARRRQMKAPRAAHLLADVFYQNKSSLLPAPKEDSPPCAIAGYWPLAHEISPLPLLERLYEEGFACALPALEGEGWGQGEMRFRAYAPHATLKKNALNSMEPLGETPEVTPDIVLVPLVAFDKFGHRLGYGHGYYDRALAFLRGEKAIRAIGLAFEAQEVSQIPHEPHDETLDAVLTEKGVSFPSPHTPMRS